MLIKFALPLASVLIATSAFALDQAGITQSVTLTDGTTVHVFADGRMAMEDRLGNAVAMPAGQVMETGDGRKITMQGNEVARLDTALRQDLRGG